GFQIADVVGPFHAARLDVTARVSVLVRLVGTVGLLAGLEAALRTSRRDARGRIKYLVLGLGGVLLARFYFMSQVALFNVEMATYLITGAAAGLLYLREVGEACHHATAAVGARRPVGALADAHPLIAALGARPAPLVLENGSTGALLESPTAAAFPEGSVLVPLRWRDELA